MTVDEIKKVLLVYGYEKVNDNEYKYDDDFLTKFSIYFKNNDVVYFQKGINNKVNLYIDQINDVNVFNPNWLEGKIKEESKEEENISFISKTLKEHYGKHFYIKVDCNDVYTFYNYDDEVIFTYQNLGDENYKYHYDYVIMFNGVEIYRDQKYITKDDGLFEWSIINGIIERYNLYKEYVENFNKMISQ